MSDEFTTHLPPAAFAVFLELWNNPKPPPQVLIDLLRGTSIGTNSNRANRRGFGHPGGGDPQAVHSHP